MWYALTFVTLCYLVKVWNRYLGLLQLVWLITWGFILNEFELFLSRLLFLWCNWWKLSWLLLPRVIEANWCCFEILNCTFGRETWWFIYIHIHFLSHQIVLRCISSNTQTSKYFLSWIYTWFFDIVNNMYLLGVFSFYHININFHLKFNLITFSNIPEQFLQFISFLFNYRISWLFWNTWEWTRNINEFRIARCNLTLDRRLSVILH